MSKGIILESTITCPKCGHKQVETMPVDSCQWFYDCRACGALLKPKSGDCCVFCSYGSTPCPSIQQKGGSCCSTSREVGKKPGHKTGASAGEAHE